MFNLKKAKKHRPIDSLREIDPDLRYGDLDMEEEEVEFLASALMDDGDIKKEAFHGQGDGWTAVGPGERGSYYSKPTMDWAPQFGGRWRNQGGRPFPGSGDRHIDDDSDKNKSLKRDHKGNDFDPTLRNKMINDHLGRTPYRVKIHVDAPSEDKAKEMLGDGAQYDDHSVFLEVEDYQDAIKLEKQFLGSGLRITVEPIE